MSDGIAEAQRGILWGAALTLAILVPMLAFVFAIGATPMQRCVRAYPRSPERQELCMERIAKEQGR